MSLEDEVRFSQARKQLVAKRVDAIQQGRFSFTLVETKAVNYILSKVKPTDSPDTEYIFNIGEFCRMIGWNRLPTKEILGMLQTIANKSWWIMTDVQGDGPEYELRHWFDVVRLNEGRGTITITFSQTVVPYIFNLLEQQKKGQIYIASWAADAISLMKNQYSPRIFELLRTYEFNNEEWLFENGTGTARDLQTIIADRDDKGAPVIPVSWSKWASFERNVLAPAKREINKYTDLMIDYEPLKRDFAGNKYRKYVAIRFRLSEKTAIEIEKKDKIIAEEYNNVIDALNYEQVTISSFEKERARQREIAESELKEREIEKSRFPLLKSMFPEFNDIQLEQLYRTAKEHMIEDIISDNNRELWIADYINEYYKYIVATPEQTKISFFARLYDCLKNDYKHYAYQVTLKYDKPVKINHSSNYEDVEKTTFPVQKEEIEQYHNMSVKKGGSVSTEESDEMFEEELMIMMKNIRKTGK